MNWIFIYGPPGSGKTTLGQRLARHLNRPHYDLDTLIAARSGQTIPQIFARQGETVFRQIERAVLEETLLLTPGIVSLGGGALLDQACRQKVEAVGEVICLNAPLPVLLQRLRPADGERPLLAGDLAARLQALLAQRADHYASFGIQISAGDRSAAQISWEVQRLLGLFHVRGMGAGYDIRIARGLLDHLGEMLAQRGLHSPVAVVADTHVAPLYMQRALASLRTAGFKADSIEISSGEEHKTLQTVQSMWRAFLQAGLERTSTVVAMGGGVTTDMAGFAAAMYLRGIPWVSVPTSLLGMVDASLGGKTGADLPEGKNLIGAFYAPRLVLTDPDLLCTLPETELRSGLAEAYKHGILADAELFERCLQGWQAVQQDWAWLVRRAVAVKVRTIQLDPYEKGRRAALNFGHTVGHGLEKASHYRISHGEAVAIGMVIETRLAEVIGLARSGLADKIAAGLVGLGLPVQVPPDLDCDAILQAMQKDKKRQDGRLRFALPQKTGRVQTGIVVEMGQVRALLLKEA